MLNPQIAVPRVVLERLTVNQAPKSSGNEGCDPGFVHGHDKEG